jgi:two-component system response regulator PilR (NtrC family)
MKTVLVVDDEEGVREALRHFLERDGFRVRLARDGREALQILEGEACDLAFLDIMMPGLDGIETLRQIRGRHADLPVVMVTAYASAESTIQAMRLGAFDYITKPWRIDEVRLVMQRAWELAALARQAAPPAPSAEPQAFGGILGRSPKMVELYKLISRVAEVNSTVLIAGESGTGKELVARTIHHSSPRAGRPFIPINCGAIPETLLESELFGHVKGSFTGAIASKVGLFETADGGTLFLDEVAETTPAIQVKLLRVLQDRVFRRVGGTEDLRVDVRVIAATNRDLPAAVQRGAFREDLYYRLNVIPLHLPPLRERREDIPLLVEAFLARFAAESGHAPLRPSPAALALLAAYEWPGNVRELENVIERAVALETSPVLSPASLPELLRAPGRPSPSGAVQAPLALPPEGLNLEETMRAIERALILEALERSGGRAVKAAELLQVSFEAFRYRLKKHGVERDGRPVD